MVFVFLAPCDLTSGSIQARSNRDLLTFGIIMDFPGRFLICITSYLVQQNFIHPWMHRRSFADLLTCSYVKRLLGVLHSVFRNSCPVAGGKNIGATSGSGLNRAWPSGLPGKANAIPYWKCSKYVCVVHRISSISLYFKTHMGVQGQAQSPSYL